MASQTPKLGLTKPSIGDNVAATIGALADNFDILDDLVEYGSTGNGAYAKLPSGVLLCWTELNMGSRTSSGTGTYADPYRTGLMDWTFPVAFVNLPQVFLTHKVGAGATARAMTAGYAFRTTTQARDIQVVAVTSDSSSENVYLDVLAIGRWS